MKRSLFLNIFLAGIWILLSKERTLWNFLVGFSFSFLVIALFPSLLGSRDYVRRASAFFYFLFHFIRVFFRANCTVAAQVLWTPREEIPSRFIEFPVESLGEGEILLLSHCITLTPGTTTVEILEHPKRLLIHSMIAEEDRAIEEDIRVNILEPLMEFTR